MKRSSTGKGSWTDAEFHALGNYIKITSLTDIYEITNVPVLNSHVEKLIEVFCAKIRKNDPRPAEKLTWPPDEERKTESPG